MAESGKDLSHREPMKQQTAHITIIFIFMMKTSGRIMLLTKAGGGMIHCRNSITRVRRISTAISWRSGKNGYLHLTMQMAGDLMLQQIWGTVRNSTISSGVISVKQSRVQTRMPSFWQSIMGMRLPGYRAMPGIRS